MTFGAIALRVWKTRRLSNLADIQPGTTVQLNLAWAQGWGQQEFRVRDIWLDDESRKFATELQRRRHVRYERQRWSPAWIDHVEVFDFGGGIVTLTLFEVDQEIIDDFRKEKDDRIVADSMETYYRVHHERLVNPSHTWDEIEATTVQIKSDESLMTKLKAEIAERNRKIAEQESWR